MTTTYEVTDPRPGQIHIKITGRSSQLMSDILHGQGWRYSKPDKSWFRIDTPAGQKALITTQRMLDKIL